MRKYTALFLFLSFISSMGIGQNSFQIDSVSRFSYGSTELNDVWGYVDSLGNEYALVGKRNGLSILSLADTNNLVEVFTENSTFSVWRDIKTWGHFAYVTNETSGGLAIYDLSTLPDSVKSVTYFTGINYRVDKAHNIFIDENGVAYLFGSAYSNPSGSFGTIMLDVATNPGQPIELGYFGTSYLHDGYARGDTLYGSAVYAGELLIIDVSNKSNPQIIGSKITPSNFTHNSWLSDNGQYVFTTDEVSGGYIAAYDVSNPSSIFQTDRLRSRNTTNVIPHNTHVYNDFLVTSYYTLGVSIVDAHRPSNLVEIGYYDTSPLYSGSTFNGNWGAYPFLPSGLLVLTDIEEGMYLLRPTYKRASYLEGKITDCGANPVPQALIKVLGTTAETTTNLNGDYKTGTAEDGYFRVQISATGYQTSTLDSVLMVPGQLTIINHNLMPLGSAYSGVFIDSSLKKIKQVQIHLESVDSSYIRLSNDSGRISIQNLPVSNYELEIGKWGYKNQCISSFSYNCNQMSSLFLMSKGVEDFFNVDLGWTVTGNDVNGAWTRAKPIATFDNSNMANPGSDENTDCGSWAFITGNGVGTANDFDVDSTTVLISPKFDLSAYNDAYINFSTWFYNEGIIGNDYMLVSGKDSSGAIYTIDTIYNQNQNWMLRSYRLSDFSNKGKFRYLYLTVKDNAPDHIVEAGIDHLTVSEGIFIGISEEKIAENLLDIYPNPFQNSMRIQLNDEALIGSILQIYSSSMQLIKEQRMSSMLNEIHLSEEISKGLYFVRLQGENGTLTRKLIKN